MESVIAFRPLPSCFAPCRNLPSSIFTTANRRIRIQTSASKIPRNSTPIPLNLRPFTSPEPSRTSTEQQESPVLSAAARISRQVVLALFCFAIGFAPFRSGHAVAAPAVLDKEASHHHHHEYSKYSKRLLEAVAVLLARVEEVRRGSVAELKAVEAALKAVRAEKEELQEEIMSGLHLEVMELRREKEALVKRLDDVFDEVVKVKRELGKLLGENVGQEKVKEMMEGKLEKLEKLEEEYNRVWVRVGEIEDGIWRGETEAFSFGVRELCFIERECEELVKSFTSQMRRKDVERYGDENY